MKYLRDTKAYGRR